MKYLLSLLILVLFSLKSKPLLLEFNGNKTAVSIDTLFTDKISIRAIEIDQNKVWYAADNNRFGYVDQLTNQRVERKISMDSLKLEFRSIAQNKSDIYILSVGNPDIPTQF